jgi:hypothetical protein
MHENKTMYRLVDCMMLSKFFTKEDEQGKVIMYNAIKKYRNHPKTLKTRVEDRRKAIK